MPLLISPIDGVAMRQIRRYGIELDVCPTSGGVWLDKGELEKLIALVTDEAVLSVEADVERSRKAGRTYGEDVDDDDFDDHRRRGGKRRSRFMDIFD
jgi:Zn-finger nucleic acid-binding protein